MHVIDYMFGLRAMYFPQDPHPLNLSIDRQDDTCQELERSRWTPIGQAGHGPAFQARHCGILNVFVDLGHSYSVQSWEMVSNHEFPGPLRRDRHWSPASQNA